MLDDVFGPEIVIKFSNHSPWTQTKCDIFRIPLDPNLALDYATGEATRLLSFDEAGPTEALTPLAKAMEYAERAEYMYIAPGQATVSVLLALFWLKVAELESRGILESDVATPDPSGPD